MSEVLRRADRRCIRDQTSFFIFYLLFIIIIYYNYWFCLFHVLILTHDSPPSPQTLITSNTQTTYSRFIFLIFISVVSSDFFFFYCYYINYNKFYAKCSILCYRCLQSMSFLFGMSSPFQWRIYFFTFDQIFLFSCILAIWFFF